jgi:hypothetical protein
LNRQSRSPSSDVCWIKIQRRREMRSRRRAPRLRAIGWLNALWEFVIASVIYLGPPLICAAPLPFLYWLYRPSVLANPGLGSLKKPVATAVWLPLSRPEGREDVATSRQVALVDSAQDFAQLEPGGEEPKSRPGSGGSPPIAGRSELRFVGRAGRRAREHKVSAAVANPRQYAGVSRDPFSAYEYAAAPSGRQRW